MKKNSLALVLFFALSVIFLSAQPNLQGINFQGVARDGFGKLIPNTKLLFRMSLVSVNGNDTLEIHYSEDQQITTDDLGLFNFIIGKGKENKGSLAEVPWAEQSIFLQTEVATDATQQFALLNRTELLAVPYAYYSATAERLVPDEEIDLPTEKNQSLYWTTGGNVTTKPPTHFVGTQDKQPLIFKTNNIKGMELDTSGRLLVFNRTPAGPDNNKLYYPVVIEGTQNTQGIWIEINGPVSKANNFLTFEDDFGVQGRVEGQTIKELEESFTYQYTAAVFAINGVEIAANIVALTLEAFDGGKDFWKGAKLAVAIGKIIDNTAKAASLLAASIAWDQRIRKSIGVTYSSSAGDYAEWLKRKSSERELSFGEIVGVDGGVISLNTEGTKQLMVVSQNPIVLGNTPPDSDKAQYEKVAFLGQVLVKVAGKVNIGDYILPSGNNDGCGVAVAPSKMKAGDYDKIVGVAWEAAEDRVLNFVNVAIGVNNNDLAAKLADLDQRLDNILAYLDGKTNLPTDAVQRTMTDDAEKPSSTFGKLLTDEEFDQFVDQNEVLIRQIFSESKKIILSQGYGTETIQQFDQVFADPVKMMKAIRRDPNYLTYWHSIDQKLLPKNK